jgi:hypothetical protein
LDPVSTSKLNLEFSTCNRLWPAQKFLEANRNMISAALLRRYSAQLHPFTLHLADGRKIRVPHGDHISVQPEGRVFLLWKAKGNVEFINLTMVTSLRGRQLPDEVAT